MASLHLARLNAAEIFDASSISVENRSPYVMLFGLARADLKPLLEPNQVRSRSSLELANYLSAHNDQDEFFFVDGETLIIQQALTYALGDYHVSLSIPWIQHGSGKLDRSIYQFHDVLHMPQNGRTDARHDEFNWRVSRNGRSLAPLNRKVDSIGDIRLTAYKSFRDRQWQASAMLKLPTGQFGKQSGSRSADIGAAIVQHNPDWLNRRNWLSDIPLAFWWGGGLTYLGEAGPLSALGQRRWAATARSGIAWACSDHWQIKGQLDSNSPLFDSDIRELGWIPLQASIGGQYSPNETYMFELSIIEDLRPRVTPDVIFNLALETVF